MCVLHKVKICISRENNWNFSQNKSAKITKFVEILIYKYIDDKSFHIFLKKFKHRNDVRSYFAKTYIQHYVSTHLWLPNFHVYMFKKKKTNGYLMYSQLHQFYKLAPFLIWYIYNTHSIKDVIKRCDTGLWRTH